MPEMHTVLPDGLVPKSMIDLKSDARTRRTVFVVRMIAVVFFVPLFAGIPLTFRYSEGFDPVLLWSLGLQGQSGLISFVVLTGIAMGSALLHESIRAMIIKIGGGGRTSLSFDGVAPKISAPDTVVSKVMGIAIAAAPFLFVSTIGMVALLIVPDRFVAWVFLPTVIHNVISAADFVLIAWLIGIDKTSLVRVLPDGWVAYARQ